MGCHKGWCKSFDPSLKIAKFLKKKTISQTFFHFFFFLCFFCVWEFHFWVPNFWQLYRVVYFFALEKDLFFRIFCKKIEKFAHLNVWSFFTKTHRINTMF